MVQTYTDSTKQTNNTGLNSFPAFTVSTLLESLTWIVQMIVQLSTMYNMNYEFWNMYSNIHMKTFSTQVSSSVEERWMCFGAETDVEGVLAW